MLTDRYPKTDQIGKKSFNVLSFALLSVLFTAVALGSAGDAKELLTHEERLWLTNNQSHIVLAVETGYAPFVFLDAQGQPTGLAHDYIRLIEAKIGISFKQNQFSSLNDIFDKVRTGEVHIVNAVTQTPARIQFLTFTEPFISVPNVILVRKDRGGPMSERSLSGLKVALVKSYAITENLSSKNLGFTPDLVADDLTALLDVSFGHADAAVIDLATASYLISKKGITNLRVAGETELSVRLAIGTPVNAPLLSSILQKGLAAITNAEREEIRNKWINTSGQSILSDGRLWLAAGIMLFTILAAITIISVWNRMLRQQVRARTTELEEERSLLEQRVLERTAELARSEAQLRSTLDHTPNVAVQWYDDAGRITYWNPASEKFFGWKAEEALGKTLDMLIFAAEVAAEFQRILVQIKESGCPYGPFETEIHTRSGCKMWILSTVFAVPLEDEHIGFVCMDIDITERILAEHSLRASEEKLRGLYELAPLGIALTDMTGRYIEFNEAFRVICGYSADELKSIDYWTLTPKEYEQDEARQLESLKRFGCYGPYEKKYRRKDGSLVSINLNGRLVSGSDDQRYIWSIVEDISVRKQEEAKLQLAASVFSHAREGIMITDASTAIIEVNDTFCDLTGYSREEALGKKPGFLHSGRHEQSFYALMWDELNTQGFWSGEVWNRRKNGQIYPEMLTISAVHDSHGKIQNYVALFTDITSIKEHQQQLEHIAHYDRLTGLPNRVLLTDRLQQAMIQCERHSQSLAVLYIDLDGFKTVNDRYGHDMGDQLLIAVSKRLKEALRKGDTLSRIGGDEFIGVLVDLVHMAEFEPVLERLLQAAAKPVFINQVSLQVSASIGITLYPHDKADTDQLLRHADQAMYIAKQAGKNRYHVFDVRRDVAVKTQFENIERIRYALDQGEFVLHYQPKVNMKTGAMIGAEALIRWQHPERGLLPPSDFLPYIENHPICVSLGEWVIDSALTQINEWSENGLSLSVSVNIDAYHLQQLDFPARLSALLSRHPNVQSGCLELEILESSALQDMAAVIDIMNACREMGVHLALDDFGTGFSSLTYLRRFPADTLKIDQSFVRDMLDDPDDLAIVKGVIGLATAFRRQVIAEGVETIAHGTQLLLMGCVLAQGYGIARPMPAAEMPGWVSNWRPDKAWNA
jgi:diguanylate cyclase (GGDEF)-like protein/PAS domain S-box-containing protein